MNRQDKAERTEQEKATTVTSTQTVAFSHKNTVNKKFVRSNYADAQKMKVAKSEIFGDKKTVQSIYNDMVIHRSHKSALKKYKGNASKHQGELDHTVAVKKAYDFGTVLPGISDSDISKAANKHKNFRMIDKHLNASLGEKSKTKYALSTKKLSSKTKKKLVLEDIKAQFSVKGELVAKSVANTSKMPMSIHLAQYMQGEQALSEAVIGTVTDTVKAEVSGIVVNGGVKITQNVLDKAQEQIVQKAGKNALTKICKESASKALSFVGNNVTTIVEIAMYTGNSVVKYAKGEITATEMVGQIGESSIALATSFGGAAIGAAIGDAVGLYVGTMILPGIGSAVGLCVGDFLGEIIGGAIGYIVGTGICQKLKKAMETPAKADEYRRIAQMYREYAKEVERSRIELERYLQYIHKEQQSNIRNGFENMKKAIDNNSAQDIADSIDFICQQFDIETQFKTLDEFESKISNPDFVFSIGENT